MNARSFKTVFSKRLGALVAVGEHATSQGKANGASGPGASGAGEGAVSALAGIGYVAALSASFAFVSLAWAAPATNALPTGGTVVQGAASMSQTANQLNIQQATQRAAINWQSFNIGAAAAVNVAQPNAQAVLLNRVVGQSPSQIFGKLQANGHVILVNPNGVLFGKDGSVNAGGFTASTLNISDANFMAGNMVYERNGSTAGIVNKGKISTEPGGYVALLGATVSNEGSITTKGGSVVMGAGDTIKVPVSGTGRIKLELTPAAINASVSNSGSIVTEGGQVYMQALALNRAAAQILQSGSIDTTGEKGGDVHVLADGGHIRVDGRIKSNSNNGTAGGDIYIGRDKDTNVLAAVGDVRSAQLESRGGFVETSGDWLATNGVTVLAKEWLLDPTDIDIVAADTGTTNTASSNAGGTTTFQDSTAVQTTEVLKSTIETAINGGTNVTISTTNGAGTGQGNITIKTALSFNNIGPQDATLRLEAKNGITQNAGASITATGSKAVNVEMKADGLPGGIAVGDPGFDASKSKGIVLNSSISTNGTVKIEGTNNNTAGNSSGIRFNSGSSIKAASFEIQGKATGADTRSHGVLFQGGSNLTSPPTISITSTGSGTSVINGTSKTTISGITAGTNINGNVSFDAQNNGSMIVKGSNDLTGLGLRVSAIDEATKVTTNGHVTLGSFDPNSAFSLRNGSINANSGSLNIKGSAVSNFGGESITANNGVSINIEGKTTAGSASNAVSFTNIQIRALGVAAAAGVTAIPAGNINITGTSSTGNAINLTSNVTIEGASVALKGTSTSGAGVSGTGKVTATTGNVQIDGLTTTGGTGGSVATNNNITASNGDININGTTATANKEGILIGGGNTIEAKNIKLVGSSTGAGGAQQNAKGVRIFGALKASDSITLEGTSKNVTGVGIEGGSVTAGGAVVIQATTTAGQFQGANIGGAVQGKSVNITGNSTNERGVSIGAAVTSTGGGITIEGTSINSTGVYVYNSVTSTAGNINITGVSDKGDGVYIGNTLGVSKVTSNNGAISVVGTSDQQRGVWVDGNATVDSKITGATPIANAGVTIKGTSTGSVAKNNVGAQIQGVVSAAGKLTITGDTKGVGLYQGVNIAKAVSGDTVEITGNAAKHIGVSIQNTGSVGSTGSDPAGGASIVINGTSTGTNNAGVSVAGTVSGQSVAMTGITSGNVGVDINAAVTSTEGDIKLTGTGGSNYDYGQGVWTRAAGTLVSEKGGITIIGKSTAPGNNKNVIGSQIQGAVTAAGDIVVEGRNTGANTPKTGLSIENTIKSTGGNITVTAENTSGTDQALRLTGTGKLETVDNTKTIKINTNGLDLQGTVKAGSTGEGTVYIKTVGTGNAIDIGGEDGRSNTASAQKLGISNTELNKITAGNVVIGDTSKNGNITVSQATTSNAGTGHITLQTGGNISVNAALTIATVKTLTLNGAGASSTISQANTDAGITADSVLFLGNTATVTLQPTGTTANSANKIDTIAGNVKSFALTNQRDLTVGAVNGSNGLMASNDIKLTTTTLEGTALNIVQKIESTAGNVELKGTTSDTTTPSSGIIAAVSSAALVKGNNVAVNAVAQGTSGKTLGYRGAGPNGKFEASNNLTLIGSTLNDGSGFYMYEGALAARNTLTIEGTSAKGQGVGFDKAPASSNVNIASGNGITIKGTASNSTSSVTQAAINLKDVNLTNSAGAVTLEAIKGDIRTLGTGTLTQNGDGDVKLTTVGDGNITVPKIINNGKGNVVIAAGSDLLAGNGGGGQVKTVPGNTISQTNTTPGNTHIYSGSAANTDLLSRLDNSFSELRLSGDMGTPGTPLAQNADSNVKYAAGSTITGGAKAQVMFREKIALNTSTITGATLDKTYGDANTKNNPTDQPALFAEMQSKLKQTNPGQIITRALDVTNGTNGAGEFKISKATLINDFSGSLNTNNASFSTSQHLTATTHEYGALTSTKYAATLEAGKAKVEVAKKALTGSIAQGASIYGDALAPGNVNWSGNVVGDLVAPSAVNINTTGNISQAGYLNAGIYSGIQTVTADGNDAANYSFTNVKGDYKVDKRPLTIAPGSVGTKTADGNTTAVVTPGSLSNLVGTETLGVAATGTFSDANPGNNKAVNAFYTLQNGANGGVVSNYVLNLGTPANPDTRMTGNILASVNPVTPIAPVNNNTGSVSRVRTVSGFGNSGAATGVLDDKAVTESREVCSDVFPENCECQPSVIPSIEICFAPKSVAATKEEK
jgi:filamentous hemagglutinin family protein